MSPTMDRQEFYPVYLSAGRARRRATLRSLGALTVLALVIAGLWAAVLAVVYVGWMVFG